MLQDFLSALQEPIAETPVTPPEQLSTGDKIYLAIKGARDPEFRKRVVDPMLAEQKSYPARKAAATNASRAERIKELQSGVAAEALVQNAKSRQGIAQAAVDRARAAVAKGGRIRVLEEAVRDDKGNVIGKANAPYVEDTDENGHQILRRLEMVSTGPGGEEVRTVATPKPTKPSIVTDATGNQRVVDAFTGKDVASAGFKQPSPGIQQSAARAVSTISGFADFEKVYDDYQTQQLGVNPSLGKRLIAQGRGMLSEKFPKTGEVLDIPTSNFITARRAALNRYIKDVTGAQFSIKELERYESQLPGPGAPKESAIPKIRALVNQSLDQLRAFIRQNGGLQAMVNDPDFQAKVAKYTDFSEFHADPNNPATQRWYEQGSAVEAGPPAAAGPPPGVPAGSTRAGRSRKTGKTLWRSPSGQLWSE